MTKKAKKAAPQTPPEAPDPHADNAKSPDRITHAAIAELEAQLAIVSARRAELSPGSFDRDLANTAAALARAVASLRAELRAGEKARAFTAKSISPEILMEHLRLLSSERRTHLLRELMLMEANEHSVFG